MFNLQEMQAEGPNWDEELKEDVESECSKYGRICHVGVDTESPVRIVIVIGPTLPLLIVANDLGRAYLSKIQRHSSGGKSAERVERPIFRGQPGACDSSQFASRVC